ncbi:uncharacterized protein TA15155 [Theileria annulata]|uniref:Uncharacterized protein n=1 Tax=Theileria annulata TaxID=5874 RepID=Q4UFC6_THEAN|nr:uncharacterized protein TA15155 [Theileria annulata]CAI74190.1 hypothetical protein TA15155 [Theileria annulata]|eukprot:XP_951922.1 hypothetical protein TA15155 [Theileria annulata]
MRLRGIKFPNISEQDKLLNIPHISNTSNMVTPVTGSGPTSTNTTHTTTYTHPSYTNPSTTNTMTTGMMDDRIIGLEELDELLYNINNNNYTNEYINNIRNKLIISINILSNKSTLNNYQSQLLDKILKLNDSLLLLSNSTVTVTGTTDTEGTEVTKDTHTKGTSSMGTKSTSNMGIGSFMSIGSDEIGEMRKTSSGGFVGGPDTVTGNTVMDMENNMLELDEIFNFINFNEKNEQLIDEDDEDEEEEELINNFINLSTPKQIISTSVTELGPTESTNTTGTVVPGSSFTEDIGTTGPSTVTEGKGPTGTDETPFEGGRDTNTVTEDTTKDEKKKNISELVSELDNLEMDFGHMSMNNF